MSRYPLGVHEADTITSRTGKKLDQITLDEVRKGNVTSDDIKISAETLRRQGEVAADADNPQMAANFERAAELTSVPDDVILMMYNKLRPNRSTKRELAEMAGELLEKYHAPHCAKMVLEAAEIYEKRGEDIWIARSAKVAPTAYLHGPLIICEDAEVRHCAFIRGSALVGDHCVVGNSTELKNVILFDNVQVPHYNYVGDSILGYKSHMGAGSITSNVKSDKMLVSVKCGDERIETGIKKIGAMIGDRVEVGCNSVLNPGTVIGRDSNVYPTSCVRGVVPENSICKNSGDVIEKK